MKIVSFAIHNLKKTWKSTMFYAFTFVLTSIIMYYFVTCCMIEQNNNGIVRNFFDTKIVFPLLTCIVLTFDCFLIQLANSFFLKSNANDLMVISISGGGMREKAIYLITQNICLFLISIPFGIVIGSVLVYFTGSLMGNYFILPYLEILSLEYISYTFFILLFVLIFIIMMNCGFAYRLSLLELKSASKDLIVESKFKQFFGYFSLPLFIVSIICLLTTKTAYMKDITYGDPFSDYYEIVPQPVIDYAVFLIFGILATIGAYLFFVQTIPSIISFYQKRFALKHRKLMVAISNLTVDFKKTGFLLMMVLTSVMLISYMIGTYYGMESKMNAIIICFVILMIINLFGILYSLLITFRKKINDFNRLITMGFLRKEIHQMIYIEVLSYFAILTIFPLIIIYSFLYQFVMGGFFVWNYVYMLMIVYTITNIIGAISVIVGYLYLLNKEKRIINYE